ncbi:MAG: D-aminoacyl-tRNA deacylase [Veillonellales bacterium]
MRAVIQRTDKASVTVEKQLIAQVGNSLTVLLGISSDDTELDSRYLAEKIVNLRIFSDTAGKMNLSLLDVAGELLVVSQFTLMGDCRKGRRPSFAAAADPEVAKKLYLTFIHFCEEFGVRVSHGQFQAEMIVRLDNHGPVTILLDSKRNF